MPKYKCMRCGAVADVDFTSKRVTVEARYEFPCQVFPRLPVDETEYSKAESEGLIKKIAE